MQVTEYSVLYRFILIFVFITPFSLYSQHYPVAEVDLLLRKGIKSIIDQDYKRAENIFQKLNKEYPELPLGKIYLAAVKVTQAIDYGEQYDKEYIEKILDSADEISSTLLKSRPDYIWYIYFKALTNGYKAYFFALNDEYINAFKYGLNSYSDFEKCFNLDSTFYESYIAIGSYKYWRSEKTKSFSWLPFINDERGEGIKYLKIAIRNFSYNQYLALYSLIWVDINYNHSNEAIKLADSILKKYPDSRFFKWALARAYTDVDKRKAITIYKEILESVSELSKNHYNEIILKHKIAMLYHDINEDKKALKLCNEIIDIRNLSDDISEKLSDRLKRVKELKKELSDH